MLGEVGASALATCDRFPKEFMMSAEQWIQLGVKYCEKVGDSVELMEKRVYPQGILATGQEQYRVVMRRCSAGYQCSHLEDPCVWVDSDADGRQYNR